MALPSPEELAGALRFGARPLLADPPFGADDPSAAEVDARIQPQSGARRPASAPQDTLRLLTEAADANANIHSALLSPRDRYRDDLDYTSLASRWREDARAAVEKHLSVVSNAALRKQLGSEAIPVLIQEHVGANARALQLAAFDHAARREDLLQQVEGHAHSDPDDRLATSAIDAYATLVDNACDRGFLTPQQAAAEKQEAALRLCAKSYSVMARNDPERAVRELESDTPSHPVAQFLPPTAKEELVQEAKDQQQIQALDAERTERITAREAARTSDEAEHAYALKLLADDPTVTIDQIYRDNKLSIEGKRRLLEMGKTVAEPAPSAAISRATTLDLIERIRKPDGTLRT